MRDECDRLISQSSEFLNGNAVELRIGNNPFPNTYKQPFNREKNRIIRSKDANTKQCQAVIAIEPRVYGPRVEIIR
mgnify:CR=1 FL=1